MQVPQSTICRDIYIYSVVSWFVTFQIFYQSVEYLLFNCAHQSSFTDTSVDDCTSCNETTMNNNNNDNNNNNNNNYNYNDNDTSTNSNNDKKW